MTALPATPERIIAAIEMFPDHIQKQFLIDRMDMYLGYGTLPQGGEVPFKILHMDNPEEAEELLQFKLKIVRESKTISEVFWRINKPDRLQLLRFLARVYVFDRKEYSQLLREVWISTEFPHQMTNRDLIDLFKNADPYSLMTENEIKALGVMPDEITVYRGLQDDRARHKALSWTTSYGVAQWFARRWKTENTRQAIYRAVIKKKHVYMYTNDRSEEEVVVNPNHLKQMVKMEAL